MSAKTEAKATRYLTEGKVSVMGMNFEEGTALVHVTGSLPGDPYHVRYNGSWLCDCPARIPDCAHVIAASRVVRVRHGSPKVPRLLSPAGDLAGFLMAHGG